MSVIWDVAPYGLVEVYGRFSGACCLHHQGDQLTERKEMVSSLNAYFSS
jgi:hypothetical protein